jgi:phytanoyl-CoA hydroxylase
VSLSQVQRDHWNDNGYLVVEGFFSETDVKVIEEALVRTWRLRPSNVTVDDLATGERLRASQVTDEARKHNFKVNDIYLVDPEVRAVISSERVVALTGELLEDQPVVCNTLNLERGSQQADHLDTLYMTPRSDRGLVATWMALEDTHADAGPLRYWPGSHRIEPFRFSNGSLHVADNEMSHWADYMASSVESHGLAQQTFIAERGDLFIWNALLLHGGSEICNPNLTRNSLVTHFWSKSDCDAGSILTRPTEGGAGFWMDRPSQPIPGEEMNSVEAELAERSAAETLIVAPRELAIRSTSLYERLRSLMGRPHH